MMDYYGGNPGPEGVSPVNSVGEFFNDLTGKTSQNIFNAAEAQKNRQFQEYMSSTAYQRAAKDMKAAGINPATLTGLNGSSGAASTPSGAAASGSSSSNGAMETIVGALVKIAIAVAA